VLFGKSGKEMGFVLWGDGVLAH